ncbi:MAG: hypothetical protein IPH09_12005 [bacterium]|nr:hypothetical protein [bacterium]
MKSVLIVFETAFRYSWQGSTSRILDVSRALSGRGWNCTLLAGAADRITPGVSPEHEFAGSVVRTPFSGIYPQHLRDRLPRWMYREYLTVTGRGRRVRDPERGWPARASDWYNANRPDRPDVVIGMTTGHVGSLVAARRIADHFASPLVLEFQDPCPSLEMKTHAAELAALEQTIQASVLILTTTRSMAEDIAVRHSVSRDRIVPVFMSYDEANPPARLDHGGRSTVILHAGALAGGQGRNVRIVVEALAKAIARHPEYEERRGLDLLGAGVGGAEAIRLAGELGISRRVRLLPEEPRDEALARMSRSGILLLVKYADPKHSSQIPGKLFQYLGRGLPILGVMPVKCEAADILQQSGLGAVFDNQDLDGITDFISEFAMDAERLSARYTPNWDYIQQFSLASLGRQLDVLLSDVCRDFMDRRTT